MAPKSLTNDEVYALTAYILYLNDLLDEDAVLTQKNLPGVEMPGRARSVDMSSGK
jgi:cytochrome c